MPRRRVLSDAQVGALLDLPTQEALIIRYYTLSEDDLAGPRNPCSATPS